MLVCGAPGISVLVDDGVGTHVIAGKIFLDVFEVVFAWLWHSGDAELKIQCFV